MKPQRAIHIYSTVNGIESEETGVDHVYYGGIQKIPAADFDSMNLQPYLDQIHIAIEKIVNDLPDNIEAGAVIELYHVVDPDTHDVFVMWRVPVREKGSLRKNKHLH